MIASLLCILKEKNPRQIVPWSSIYKGYLRLMEIKIIFSPLSLYFKFCISYTLHSVFSIIHLLQLVLSGFFHFRMLEYPRQWMHLENPDVLLLGSELVLIGWFRVQTIKPCKTSDSFTWHQLNCLHTQVWSTLNKLCTVMEKCLVIFPSLFLSKW